MSKTIKSSVRPETGPKRDLRPAGAFVLAVAGVLGLALSAAQQARADEAPDTLVAWEIVAGHGHELDADQRYIASLPGAATLDALDGELSAQACGEYVQIDLYRNTDDNGQPVSSLWASGWLNPDRDGGFLAYDVLPTPYETKEIPACQTTAPTSSPTPSASPSPTDGPSASATSSPSDSPLPSSTPVPTSGPSTGASATPIPTPSNGTSVCDEPGMKNMSNGCPPTVSMPAATPSPTASAVPVVSGAPSSSPVATSPALPTSTSPGSSSGSTGTTSSTAVMSSTSRPTATELASTGPEDWAHVGLVLSIIAIGLGVTGIVMDRIRRTGGRRKGTQR